MYYRRERRRRRHEDTEDGQNRSVRGNRRYNRGARFTFGGFFAIAACLAIVKVSNPDLPLRTPLLMFAGVVLGCLVMFTVGRRMK